MKSLRKKKNRYRTQNGRSVIDVRIRSVAQLFDARDPAPFRERDLDDDFVEYITSSAEELTSANQFKIVIHIEETPKSEVDSQSLIEAIKDYFDYQNDLKSKQLSKVLRTGQFFLLLGILFLFGCLLASKYFSDMTIIEENYRGFLREGFMIMGWVAMWKPLELILFDWWPLYDKMRLYQNLIFSDFEIICKKES